MISTMKYGLQVIIENGTIRKIGIGMVSYRISQ